MYPNPQDVLPLPPRPDLEHYRKRARSLVRACHEGDEAIAAWSRRWIEHLDRLSPDSGAEASAAVDRRTRQVAAFARERLGRSDCGLSQAQFVIARAHGFASWTVLARHIRSLAADNGSIAAFERGADAVVSGDAATLARLLIDDPGLVHARSSRAHGATLLHYVSANGVENYRQRTPANIVDIARRLLDAGADIDAEADVYGGGATTLGLVVTSAHPRRAGVQDALADLLLERGARMRPGIVWSCLANGCPEAAAHIARRGAPVDAKEAAGIGRVDLLARRLAESAAVAARDGADALIMATWYGEDDAVRFLLDHGVDIAARPVHDGQTALHVAAYQGDADLVALLLERAAPVDVADDLYGTPPLVWALHAWLVDGHGPADRYATVLVQLADAGARVEAEWIDDERIRAHPALYGTLLARVPGT